jgi:hypothetical protein
MEFRGKPHTDKYKGVTNDSNCRQLYAYVTSGLGLEYFDRLIFVAQGVHILRRRPLLHVWKDTKS